jgi:hypothetical protein
MELTDLLGVDIRSKNVAAFLESRSAFVDLDALEADGIVQKRYLTAKEQGLSIVANPNMAITSLQLYGQDTQGFQQYSAALPHNLIFGESSTEARKKLGMPEKSGTGKAQWDRFDMGKYYLHLQYENDRLVLVTLMTPAVVPGGLKNDPPRQS